MTEAIHSNHANLQAIRETAVLLLASSISKMFPRSQLVRGEANELGFYYDFVGNIPIDDSFIVHIEESMRGIAKSVASLSTREMMRENASDFFAHRQQPIKAETIASLPYNIVLLIELNDFFDLAPKNYVEEPREVLAFKILSISKTEVFHQTLGWISAIRITGTAFSNTQDLKMYLKRAKEYKSGDHRKYIAELDLLSFQEKISSMTCFWLPNGMIVRKILTDLLLCEQHKQGIKQVITPSFIRNDYLQKVNIFEDTQQIGAFDFEGEEYNIAASPAVAHATLFRAKERKENELPIRYAELKEAYSTNSVEHSFWGFLKTATYTSDYMHIFCTEEQLQSELTSTFQLITKMINLLGFRCQWVLRVNGESGNKKHQQQKNLLAMMEDAATASKITYIKETSALSEEKIRFDCKLLDPLEREWTGPSLGIDRLLTQRLSLAYEQKDGKHARPILLKCSILGPLERLIALLTEKYTGVFPFWLAPEQVRVVALSDKQKVYAEKVLSDLLDAGIRTSLEFSENSTLSATIHAAENKKIPFLLIIGDKEAQNSVISLRRCGQRVPPSQMGIKEFLQLAQKEMNCAPPSEYNC